jgi:hypothetical protein
MRAMMVGTSILWLGNFFSLPVRPREIFQVRLKLCRYGCGSDRDLKDLLDYT